VPVAGGSHAGKVVVTGGGGASNGVRASRLQIWTELTSMNPRHGCGGAAVTIHGANFGATRKSTEVQWHGGDTTELEDATSIAVHVPSGAKRPANVVVNGRWSSEQRREAYGTVTATSSRA